MEKQATKTATRKTQNAAQVQSYKIGKIRFVIRPVFKEQGGDTLGTVLMRLMRSELEK